MDRSKNQAVIGRDHFQELLKALAERGYLIIGPVIRDSAIVYDELTSAADLPSGWTDEQEAGAYKLNRRADGAFFGYALGPHSLKKFLRPPMMHLWRAKRDGSNFHIITENEESPKFAFIGIRSCELHAIAIQDKIFLQGNYVDPIYKTRRENAFIVAVNCGQAGGTCFCTSMNTGPKVTYGFDLAMTEILGVDRHYFLVEIGTKLGDEILCQIPHEEVHEEDKRIAENIVVKTATQMGRFMNTAGIRDFFYSNYEHPWWDDVSSRCLTCGNCTMVCPTCFCVTVEDFTDLAGEHAERWQKWDSCFTANFSYIHGSSARHSSKARYRQWLMHKLATWIDQFGTLGCVGCGRCITWCPIGIDITEEVRAMRRSERKENNNANNRIHSR